MVRYHPGWAAPLMFASSLILKGMINHCPFLPIGFLINSSSLPLTYTATIHSAITSTHKTEMHRGKSEKCLWCISTSLHCPFLSIGFLINSSSLPLTYTATIHSAITSTHKTEEMHCGISEKCLWCISTSLHCPFLSIGFIINSGSVPPHLHCSNTLNNYYISITAKGNRLRQNMVYSSRFRGWCTQMIFYWNGEVQVSWAIPCDIIVHRLNFTTG